MNEFTKAEIEENIKKIYPTQYERTWKITIVETKKIIDDPMIMAWHIGKSDGSYTLVYCMKLSRGLDKWGHLMFITAPHYETLKNLIQMYEDVNAKNKEMRKCQLARNAENTAGQ